MDRPDLRVVLDPNVLVSAAISAEGMPRRILGAWHAGFFEVYASYDLLYELEAVLLRPKFRSRVTYLDVLAYVRWVSEGSVFAESLYEREIERVSADPDDDYLFDLALGLDYLVSGDPHLLRVEDERLTVLSPRTFWDDVLVPRL